MYNLRITFLFLLFLPALAIAQRSNKGKQGNDIRGKQCNISAMINYDTDFPEFSWSSSFSSRIRDLDLTFLTSTSGTFEAETDSIEVTEFLKYNLPVSKLGLGFSLEIINPKQLYHSFQIPSLQLTRFENTTLRTRVNLNDPRGTFDTREYQSLRTFMFAFKYEIGKYLGSVTSDKIRFGFGFNLSSRYYSFKGQSEFGVDIRVPGIPTQGHLLDLNFGLGSSLWLQLTDNFSLDLKYAPYVRLGTLGDIRYESPILPSYAQNGKRSGESPSFGSNIQLGLKFKIKDFDLGRKGRRG